VAKVTAGINLLPNMSLLLTERYHDVRVDDGIISNLPQTKDVFPNTPGIQGAQILGHGLTFLYDSRDSVLTPLRGAYLNMLAEFDQDLKPSQPNHWWRLTLDARKLLPHASDRMVFVGRFLIDSVLGQDDNSVAALRQGVPFYERPTLGGENTLRGFGRSRFISNLAILVNLEERIQVLKQRIFDHVIELEVAPFLDMGRVARNFTADGSFLQHLQVNPGVGVRLIARPNVVGRLDIGFGRDGETVFVGLDYPF
jgi:outer membrane protein assembly factor BamA